MRRIQVLAVVVLMVACAPSVALEQASTTTTTVEDTTTTTSSAATAALSATADPGPFELGSIAFTEMGAIPVEHTCDGPDVSPPLRVSGLPDTTESVVVVAEDPDTPMGTWPHWVLFDVPVEPTDMRLPEGKAGGGLSALNSWNVTGYKGPCPPDGEEHRYVFTVYALSGTLGLPEGVEASAVYEAMQDLVISSTQLTGIYGR
jgi:Raf kinase inhibitor-like YbhB/YbcL family protein